ncbi:hypothetical protein CDD83_6738 [Cordyceps sp. RAO-2017]|nr:hypothetical protein CDD83_6738 [Cordyceps sp. RAO-2017]
MAPIVVQGDDMAPVFDIRQDMHSIDLANDIRNGLAAANPFLPSLLLWDDRGQKLFDDFSQTASYYPFHGEVEALNLHGSHLSRSVPDGGILLELGCGAIRKTKSILFNFHRQQRRVHYIALDVSAQGLGASLVQLRALFKDSPYISLTGLLGTYDDCVAWLAGVGHEPGSVTIMWLGNSIANLAGQDEASDFLARFRRACDRSAVPCQFIVSVDVCQRRDKVLDAYDAERPKLRDFLLNAPRAANLALGYEALELADWKLVRSLDERALTFYLAAVRNVRVEMPPPADGGPAEVLPVAKGQRVRVITSGKWDEPSVDDMCDRAGFRVQQRWRDASGDYCIFLLSSV